MNYRYMVGVGLRRKGQAEPVGFEEPELKSEDFTNHRHFCEAVAEELLALIEMDEEDLAEEL